MLNIAVFVQATVNCISKNVFKQKLFREVVLKKNYLNFCGNFSHLLEASQECVKIKI